MRNVQLKKGKAAKNQIHYVPDATSLNEYEIAWAIAHRSHKKNVEYEVDGDELIEYSFAKGCFHRWVITTVQDNKVVLSSI
ncbi:hypothetical protein [Microscilla marina]|uniref:Uncharacterized protein n=1 Tax=Microscilla marina ATCC 23134 TaxID=313606 RepID=A1ZJM8_MICM2|nr:hypothetical protein [Microscilla marina]EAY29331.1 hypothetical protein M23134_01387 [Microscilla marina ATCC 23134]